MYKIKVTMNGECGLVVFLKTLKKIIYRLFIKEIFLQKVHG